MTPTIVDTIVVIVIVLSTLLAWSRGFVRESLSIIGWIVAVLVARQFAFMANPLIDEIPQLANLINGCELKTAVGFVVVFIIAMVAMAIITPLFAGMVQNSFLSAFDSGFGAFFGFARGVIMVMLMLFVYNQFVAGTTPVAIIEESRSYDLLSPSQKELAADVTTESSKVTDWLSGQFSIITRNCSTASELTTNE